MNNNIEERRVSFPIAKLLKEAEFDVPCTKYYQLTSQEISLESDYYGNYTNLHLRKFQNSSCEFYSSPTQQVACDWIRINFGIHIFVDFGLGWEGFTIPCGYEGNATTKELHWNGSNFNTPKEAIDAALEYTLTNLILKK